MQEKIPSFKGTFVQCGPGFPVLLSKKKKMIIQNISLH